MCNRNKKNSLNMDILKWVRKCLCVNEYHDVGLCILVFSALSWS